MGTDTIIAGLPDIVYNRKNYTHTTGQIFDFKTEYYALIETIS